MSLVHLVYCRGFRTALESGCGVLATFANAEARRRIWGFQMVAIFAHDTGVTINNRMRGSADGYCLTVALKRRFSPREGIAPSCGRTASAQYYQLDTSWTRGAIQPRLQPRPNQCFDFCGNWIPLDLWQSYTWHMGQLTPDSHPILA